MATNEYRIPHTLPLVPPDQLLIPEVIELDGDELVWEWGEPELRECREDVLGPFTRLIDHEQSEPDPSGVLAFTERYGPLFLCTQHDLPAAHMNQRFEPVVSWGEVLRRTVSRRYRATKDKGVASLFRCHPAGRERLTTWLEYIQLVRRVAAVAGRLGQGWLGHRSDWGELTKPEKDGILFELRKKGVLLPGGRVPSAPTLETHEEQQAYVSAWMGFLFQVTGSRILVGWEAGEGPEVLLDSIGFLGLVASQLVAAGYREELAVCYHCGAAVLREQKPATGKRAFCDDHQYKASMYAKRERRRAQRKKEKGEE